MSGACGTAPLPFLAVYTMLFLGHGLIHPVHPPDITSSQRGETIAGCVTAALFVLLCFGIVWFLNGSRRWPFAIMQLAVAGAGVYFLVDSTKGGPLVSALLLLAAALARAGSRPPPKRSTAPSGSACATTRSRSAGTRPSAEVPGTPNRAYAVHR